MSISSLRRRLYKVKKESSAEAPIIYRTSRILSAGRRLLDFARFCNASAFAWGSTSLFTFSDNTLTPHLSLPLTLEPLMPRLEHGTKSLMRDAQPLRGPCDAAAFFH